MCAHAGSDLDNEVGGWMAVNTAVIPYTHTLYCDRHHPAALYADQGAAHLTFTVKHRSRCTTI
jgi:hypothetical protein